MFPTAFYTTDFLCGRLKRREDARSRGLWQRGYNIEEEKESTFTMTPLNIVRFSETRKWQQFIRSTMELWWQCSIDVRSVVAIDWTALWRPSGRKSIQPSFVCSRDMRIVVTQTPLRRIAELNVVYLPRRKEWTTRQLRFVVMRASASPNRGPGDCRSAFFDKLNRRLWWHRGSTRHCVGPVKQSNRPETTSVDDRLIWIHWITTWIWCVTGQKSNVSLRWTKILLLKIGLCSFFYSWYTRKTTRLTKAHRCCLSQTFSHGNYSDWK